MSMYDDVHREAMHDHYNGDWDRDDDGPGPDDLRPDGIGGRGDPALGDTFNDRRAPGGTQPRRSGPYRGGESPEMTAVLGPKVQKYAKGGTGRKK